MPNSRQLALEALLEWENSDTYAHDIVERLAAQHQLEHRDAALLQTLVLGVLRNINLLDCWKDELCSNKHLEDSVHWLVRLGLAQLLILEMPPHAVVNETVSLAGKARGLVNAVLRRADRERVELNAWKETFSLSNRFSQPDWLVERWQKQLGSETTRKLCEWNQLPPHTFIRLNRLHPNPLGESDVSELTPTARPDFFQTPQPPRNWLVEGQCYVQDLSTAVACDLLAPQPGDHVLDACAAPGGKTAYLAQMMQNQGTIIAADAQPRRVTRLQENLRRLHVTNVKTYVHDWTKQQNPAWGETRFDRILLDVPCSNTGVMRRRVDVRWRLEPWIFDEMAALQLRIQEATLALLKPGGILVYSTCSLDQEENEDAVQTLLKKHPRLQLLETQTSLPWRDGVDGAFAAKLQLF